MSFTVFMQEFPEVANTLAMALGGFSGAFVTTGIAYVKAVRATKKVVAIVREETAPIREAVESLVKITTQHEKRLAAVEEEKRINARNAEGNQDEFSRSTGVSIQKDG